jgi:hypothetical protein
MRDNNKDDRFGRIGRGTGFCNAPFQLFEFFRNFFLSPLSGLFPFSPLSGECRASSTVQVPARGGTEAKFLLPGER